MKSIALLFFLVGLESCGAFLTPVTLSTWGRKTIMRLTLAHDDKTSDNSVDGSPDESIFYLDDGRVRVPFYALQFDKDGICTNMKTQDRFLSEVDNYSDVYIVSHGWNTEAEYAIEQYKNWTKGYMSLRDNGKYPIPNREYSPVLVGVVWPSKWNYSPLQDEQRSRSLMDVFASPRVGFADGLLDIAGSLSAENNYEKNLPRDIEVSVPQDDDLTFRLLGIGGSIASAMSGASSKYSVSDEIAIKDFIDDCKSYVSHQNRVQFGELLNQDFLDEEETANLMSFIQPIAKASGILEEDAERMIKNLGQGVARLSTSLQSSSSNTGSTVLSRGFDVPALSSDDAKMSIMGKEDILGLLSFWQMRIRSRQVGREGVNKLLLSVLTSSPKSRVHLIGHSFGCSVVLSAVTKAVDQWPRRLSSMLLLQPAIEHRVFAKNDELGIFREAFERVEHPILSTFTNEDDPLRVGYHVALGDVADSTRIAKHFALRAIGRLDLESDEPPSKYAALGGYPPNYLGGDELKIIDSIPIGQKHSFGTEALNTVKMHKKIEGHTDIFKDDVYWLLYNLVQRS